MFTWKLLAGKEMLMFVHELSQQPIKTSASRRNSLQDGDVSIGYDKGMYWD